jgi:hypothetical protein
VVALFSFWQLAKNSQQNATRAEAQKDITMNIFSRILALGSIVNDARKTISDGEQILADVTTLESDPAVQAAIAASPELQGAVTRISTEIRSFQEDINRVKADLRF